MSKLDMKVGWDQLQHLLAVKVDRREVQGVFSRIKDL